MSYVFDFFPRAKSYPVRIAGEYRIRGNVNREREIIMANLNVRLGRLDLKNPIIIASSPLTAKLELIKQAEDNSAACVSIKHTMLKQPFQVKPRMFVDKKVGIINSGDQRLMVEYTSDLVRKVKEQCDIKVVVNMSATPDDITSWGKLASLLAEAGADGVEVNLNCPNLTTAEHKGTAGANMGADPDSCGRVIHEIKHICDIPIIAKLITEGGRMLDTAKACEEAGADAVNIHAGGRAAPGLDIYNRGAIKYPGSTRGNLAGHTGPWSKYLSNRYVAEGAKVLKCQIVGGGGIFAWGDIVESLMYGSSAVQICTAVMFNGFGIIKTMVDKISLFMDEQGYETVDSMRGIALKNICAPGQMDYTDVSAVIDQNVCTGCGTCGKLPTCPAISKNSNDKKYGVNSNNCLGCGLCAGLCPSSAISFEPKKEVV
jgi:dihydroorotate dehydrogenase/Pyruvate/2-oxoacid:ferredoxin oxidoreductase delta subunit